MNETRATSASAQTAGGAARSTRILILDEDRVEGGMLAFHLRREGLVVMLMTSVEEAADAIAWSAPDVILVEITARGFDGHDFLAQLATLPIDIYGVADRPVPLAVELDALRYGVIDILMKPLDPATLARRLVTRPNRERRGSVADLPEGGISGDLAVHTTSYLLQMAHRHRMNARLHVEIDGDWAVLLVRHGEVIDAEAPAATGREAAYQTIRIARGAFVLFPLSADAEELSRDDVIRADLATLVGDALGRKEPRSVNPARVQEKETFVLPHVGSPRGPLARRGGDETLEYSALAASARANNSARVKRPGEREREGAAEAATARGGAAAQPRPQAQARAGKPREATRPLLEAVDEGAEARPNQAPEQGRRETERRAEPAYHELDQDEAFDEATDQRPRDQAPSVRGARPTTGQIKRIGGKAPMMSPQRGRRPTDPELARVEVEVDEREDRPGASTSRTVSGAHRRPAPRGRSDRPAPSTIALMVLLVGLVVFTGWRLATREPAQVVLEDSESRLGKALLALDAGRRDDARGELAAIAVSSEAPSGALSMLARMHYEDGRLSEAEALLERLVQRHPKDAEMHAWLGLVQAERKDDTRARASFRRARDAGTTGPLAKQLEALIGETAALPVTP